ncbi:MAG: caspase family protein [Candidatus Nitrosopolaris sp.]|jgi:hypothetical protein
MTISINGKSARRKALVVGISDYTNLEKLDFCKNDGKEVYKVLNSLGYEISDKPTKFLSQMNLAENVFLSREELPDWAGPL